MRERPLMKISEKSAMGPSLALLRFVLYFGVGHKTRDQASCPILENTPTKNSSISSVILQVNTKPRNTLFVGSLIGGLHLRFKGFRLQDFGLGVQGILGVRAHGLSFCYDSQFRFWSPASQRLSLVVYTVDVVLGQSVLVWLFFRDF